MEREGQTSPEVRRKERDGAEWCWRTGELGVWRQGEDSVHRATRVRSTQHCHARPLKEAGGGPGSSKCRDWQLRAHVA